MLLDSNNEKVIKFMSYFDDLNNLEKLRLSIHLLESKYINFSKKQIINLLKEVLNKLDDTKGIIINFSKYKNLSLLVSKFIELSDEEKTRLIIEILFNIYETDFNNTSINKKINHNLPIYELTYELLNI